MFCENCGKEIQGDEMFCPECGYRINRENSAEQGNGSGQPVFTHNQPNQEKSKKKKQAAVLIIAAVVIVLGAAAAAAVFLFGEGDNTETAGKKQINAEDELASADVETYLDKSIAELEEMGFSEQDDLTYENADGTIWFDEMDGSISTIFMEKGCTAPFHGVKMTDNIGTTKEKLSDEYELMTETDNQLLYGSREKKLAVVISCSGDAIENIAVMRNYDFEESEPAEDSEYIFPDSDKKYLSEEEIRSVGTDKIALGRNEIYARHGYIFNGETYRQYFESLSWYEGTIPSDEFNAQAEFNDYEKKNVELIKQIEDELSGAQTPETERKIENTPITGNDSYENKTEEYVQVTVEELYESPTAYSDQYVQVKGTVGAIQGGEIYLFPVDEFEPAIPVRLAGGVPEPEVLDNVVIKGKWRGTIGEVDFHLYLWAENIEVLK